MSGKREHARPRAAAKTLARCRQRRCEVRRRLPDALHGCAECRSPGHVPHPKEWMHRANRGARPQRRKEAGRQRAKCKESCGVSWLAVTCYSATASRCFRQRMHISHQISAKARENPASCDGVRLSGESCSARPCPLRAMRPAVVLNAQTQADAGHRRDASDRPSKCLCARRRGDGDTSSAPQKFACWGRRLATGRVARLQEGEEGHQGASAPQAGGPHDAGPGLLAVQTERRRPASPQRDLRLKDILLA